MWYIRYSTSSAMYANKFGRCAKGLPCEQLYMRVQRINTNLNNRSIVLETMEHTVFLLCAVLHISWRRCYYEKEGTPSFKNHANLSQRLLRFFPSLCSSLPWRKVHQINSNWIMAKTTIHRSFCRLLRSSWSPFSLFLATATFERSLGMSRQYA